MSKVLREPWTRNLGFITRSVFPQERIQNWGGGEFFAQDCCVLHTGKMG